MSMRISSPALLSLLLLAACSKGDEAQQVVASGGDPEAVAEDDILPCALAKAKVLGVLEFCQQNFVESRNVVRVDDMKSQSLRQQHG